MNNTEPTFKKNEILLLAALAITALFLITVSVVPNFRMKLKNFISPANRAVLAKVSGQLYLEGPSVTVLKIKLDEVLILEVYSTDKEGNSVLIAKIPLLDSHDGHFFLNGNATNLALTDMDKDATLEIVAPTYDDQMVPRLNIFKYNTNANSFDRVSAPANFKSE